MKRLPFLAVLALTLATTIGAVVADEAVGTAAPVVAAAPAESPTILPTSEPEPLLKTGCTAEIICICGGSDIPLSCTGQTSCFEGTRHVTCDGIRENCPPITSCPH